MATGHAGDHERERKLAPEERRMEIDLGRIDVRQRVVHDLDVVPAGGRSRLDIGFGGEFQVLALAPRDLLRLAQSNTPSAASARYSDASSPPSPCHTSSLCSPSVGPAFSRVAGVAERMNGGAMAVTVPSTGWTVDRQNPRCRSWGSLASSAIVLTGAARISCARNRSTTSSLDRSCVHRSMHQSSAGSLRD